jgi:hypothetical protein
MNFFQCSHDFFSFAALRDRLYCLRDETVCDPDVADNLKRLEAKT